MADTPVEVRSHRNCIWTPPAMLPLVGGPRMLGRLPAVERRLGAACQHACGAATPPSHPA